MKTPTWAIAVGICLMLFGGCSVTNNIQSINMPEMIEMQKDMMRKMTRPSSKGNSDSLSIASNSDSTNVSSHGIIQNMTDGMNEMLAMSEFSKTWIVRFGYIGLFVSVLYILSGVFLLIKKRFSINLVYIALVTSILFSIIESVVLTSDSSGGLLSMTAGFGNIFGIIIDLILLVVVFSMDKSFYADNTRETT